MCTVLSSSRSGVVFLHIVALQIAHRVLFVGLCLWTLNSGKRIWAHKKFRNLCWKFVSKICVLPKFVSTVFLLLLSLPVFSTIKTFTNSASDECTRLAKERSGVATLAIRVSRSRLYGVVSSRNETSERVCCPELRTILSKLTPFNILPDSNMVGYLLSCMHIKSTKPNAAAHSGVVQRTLCVWSTFKEGVLSYQKRASLNWECVQTACLFQSVVCGSLVQCVYFMFKWESADYLADKPDFVPTVEDTQFFKTHFHQTFEKRTGKMVQRCGTQLLVVLFPAKKFW